MASTGATRWWLPLSEWCPHIHRSNHWCCGFLSILVHLSRHQEPQMCFLRKLWVGPHITSCLVCSLVPAMWAGTLRRGTLRAGEWEDAVLSSWGPAHYSDYLMSALPPALHGLWQWQWLFRGVTGVCPVLHPHSSAQEVAEAALARHSVF